MLCKSQPQCFSGLQRYTSHGSAGCCEVPTLGLAGSRCWSCPLWSLSQRARLRTSSYKEDDRHKHTCHTGTFQALAWVTSAKISLTKASHIVKFKVNGQRSRFFLWSWEKMNIGWTMIQSTMEGKNWIQ